MLELEDGGEMKIIQWIQGFFIEVCLVPNFYPYVDEESSLALILPP